MLAIRNVGEGAIKSILQHRNEHGRFRNIFEFCEAVDSRALNKRLLESLIQSGALDSLGWKRAQLMAVAEGAMEHGQKVQRDRASGQRGLFSDLIEGQAAVHDVQPPEVPEWPADQMLAYEKETLGYYVSGHPLEKYGEELRRFAGKTLAELISEGASAECRVAGIVTECRQRRTKKGELMAVCTMEDLTGATEAVVFPSAYAKYEKLLAPDSAVLVSGRFEMDEENNSCKIVIAEVQPLAGIAERNARALRIRAAVSVLAPDSVTELYRLLEGSRGDTGVGFELYSPRDFRVTIQSYDFVKVRSTPELIRQIEAICGAGSVEVIN